MKGYFHEEVHPTLGVEFTSKTVQTASRRIELQLWDTAGQELFRTVTRGYYRGSNVAYLVFDLTSHPSFVSIEKWLNDVRDVSENVITILIGNKADLQAQRNVSVEEAEKFAATHHMKYFEVSAKTGEKVSDAVESCITMIEEKADMGLFAVPSPSESIIYNQQESSNSCC